MTNDFLLHASQVGVCITPTKNELGETAKTYCQKWLKYKTLGKDRQPLLTFKYLTKGIENEEQSIQEYGALNGLVLEKNTTTVASNGLIGTPDVIDDSIIYDFKNSYSLETFPLYETKINKVYYWQLQTYMYLFELEKAKLVYALTDCTELLVSNEIKSRAYKYASENGIALFEISKEVMEQIEYKTRAEMLFSDIPIKERYIEYEIKRNETDINKIIHLKNEMINYLETLCTNK